MVLAEDALQGARMKRRTKNWDDDFPLGHRAADCKRLGSDAGHQRSGRHIGSEQQLNESDLHFLRRLLARYDADLQVVARGAARHAQKPGAAQHDSNWI